MRARVMRSLGVAGLLVLFAACGDDGPLSPAQIYAEPIAAGFLEYRDAFPPEVTSMGSRSYYTWDPESNNGPRCIGQSTPESQRFTVTTADRESEDVMIFLQGGGLCSDLTPGACIVADIPFVPFGVLSPRDQPLADYNVGYVPYCDGSLFLGDVTQQLERGETVQRGRQNITAAFDVIAAQFPNPRRVVLVGISGGGFATIFAAPMARIYFPRAEVLVVNDSGVGITRGDRDPGFVDDLLEELGAAPLLPPSCTQCFEGGHAIRFVEWTLENDPTLRMAVISHTRDNVIAGGFLDVPLDWFETELRRETALLSERFGNRYGRYLVNGEGHTFLLGVSPGSPAAIEPIFDWVGQFLDGDPTWQDEEQ